MSATAKHSAVNFRALIVLTVFSAYFYAFMEWLFFVTKPSSLSILNLFEKLKVFFVTGGAFALVILPVLLVLSVPSLLVKNEKWQPRLLFLACLVPAGLLAVTALLMLDNFTYTVFKFGIVSVEGVWRAVYAVGFTGAVLWAARRVQLRVQKRRKPASLLVLGLLFVSIAGIFSVAASRNTDLRGLYDPNLEASAERPNIIILGGDGLSSHYLSLYGYDHNTTPFMLELAKSSLLAENAFTNASSTTASTASILTGREPITVKVYRYPDVLEDEASFEHLPGILKRVGYDTVQIGTPYYVDAQKLNLLDGFDIVNEESLKQPLLDTLRAGLGNSPSAYFIWTIYERASERLLHIAFVRNMRNPLEEVNNPHARLTDEERVDQILAAVDQADRPVFIFAHLMDTHGPHFSSSQQVFSTEADEDEEWDQGRYEDAILTFDGNVKRIYDHLAETGQLDNTILVIYTDHGYKYTVYNRIPILIHFPNASHAGTRKNNIQIIDVPVTLLDYLGLSQPDWMSGISFLTNEPPRDRQIVSVVAGSPKKINPPFYQIKTVQFLICHKWYQLNVQEDKFTTGTPRGYTAHCPPNSLPTELEVREAILDYLENYDYDVSSLR